MRNILVLLPANCLPNNLDSSVPVKTSSILLSDRMPFLFCYFGIKAFTRPTDQTVQSASKDNATDKADLYRLLSTEPCRRRREDIARP